MTPLLVTVLNVNPLKAVGTDLLYSLPTRIYAAYLHWKQGTVNKEIVAALCWGGIPASVVGLAGLFWLRHHVDLALVEAWTKRSIGVALFLAAGIILVRPFLKKLEHAESTAPFAWKPGRRVRVIALGAVVGLIVTLTSIGAGAVTLPLLSLALPSVGIAELIGSDIMFAALLTPLAVAGRWTMGDVNWQLALVLLVGSLPGVWLGSKLCGRLSQKWLRPAVALTLVYVATRLI